MLWNVFRDDTTLNILFSGTYEECQVLLTTLKRASYTVKPYELAAPKRNIRHVINVQCMLGVLSVLNGDIKYRAVKQLVKFRPAPPPLIRRNAMFFLDFDDMSSTMRDEMIRMHGELDTLFVDGIHHWTD